jgi:flavin-binding protein dodecin
LNPIFINTKGEKMSVARVTEITSGSSKSFDDATEKGIKRASKTIRNIEGAWVKDQKLIIKKGKIVEYRVNMKISFVLDD